MEQITVLLAAYEGETFVAQQLDSILEQTVQDVRIMISDDGSRDGTRKILEEYREREPSRIFLNHHKREGQFQDRKGMIPPAAMNFFWLLAHAEGDYILLSDQDDVWKKQKVEVLLKRIKELESQFGKDYPILVHSDMEVVDQDLQQISPSLFSYQHGNPARTSLSEILVENPVTGGAVMMNKAMAGWFRQVPDVCFMHDWWIALTAACFGVISYVPEALYLYRQHGRNTLGARETGSVRDLAERAGRQKQVEENYRKMFAQAAALGRMYGDRLSQTQRMVLTSFLALPLQSLAGRLRNITRNHFYKSSGIQTLAQVFTIPRKDKNKEKIEDGRKCRKSDED